MKFNDRSIYAKKLFVLRMWWKFGFAVEFWATRKKNIRCCNSLEKLNKKHEQKFFKSFVFESLICIFIAALQIIQNFTQDISVCRTEIKKKQTIFIEVHRSFYPRIARSFTAIETDPKSIEEKKTKFLSFIKIETKSTAWEREELFSLSSIVIGELFTPIFIFFSVLQNGRENAPSTSAIYELWNFQQISTFIIWINRWKTNWNFFSLEEFSSNFSLIIIVQAERRSLSVKVICFESNRTVLDHFHLNIEFEQQWIKKVQWWFFYHIKNYECQPSVRSIYFQKEKKQDFLSLKAFDNDERKILYVNVCWFENLLHN